MTRQVLVVGGGISSIACASALIEMRDDVRVTVVDKASRPGGRLGARTLQLTQGVHEVDIGAAYITATSDEFKHVVNGWCDQGLLRPWTNTLGVYDESTRVADTKGPMRFAARDGLRSLVVNEFAKRSNRVDYVSNTEVESLDQIVRTKSFDSLAPDFIVLANPVQQALRVLEKSLSEEQISELREFHSSPVIAAWLWFESRSWQSFDAAFVNRHPVLSLVADDGARRGDGAPVLVAHSTPEFAQLNQKAMDGATELVSATRELLQVNAQPLGFAAHRWGLALPRTSSAEPFWVKLATDETHVNVGICGDEWGGEPKVETAWLSGARLGQFIANSLAG